MCGRIFFPLIILFQCGLQMSIHYVFVDIVLSFWFVWLSTIMLFYTAELYDLISRIIKLICSNLLFFETIICCFVSSELNLVVSNVNGYFVDCLFCVNYVLGRFFKCFTLILYVFSMTFLFNILLFLSKGWELIGLFYFWLLEILHISPYFVPNPKHNWTF